MVIFRRVSIGTSGQLPASDLLFYMPGLLSIELNVEPVTGLEPASIKGDRGLGSLWTAADGNTGCAQAIRAAHHYGRISTVRG